MCKSISPASFLALAFSRSKKEKMTYSELEACRGKITSVRSQSGEAFDVDWSHDAVRFAMGFYSPIFRDDGADILCNQKTLEKYYVRMVSSLPKGDLDRLIDTMS